MQLNIIKLLLRLQKFSLQTIKNNKNQKEFFKKRKKTKAINHLKS
jgi:hypothetical protein